MKYRESGISKSGTAPNDDSREILEIDRRLAELEDEKAKLLARKAEMKAGKPQDNSKDSTPKDITV